jgi:histone-lysine N-methyltransferase SETMAR
VEMTGNVLQTLKSHTVTNLHFPWIGDESRTFNEYHYEPTWAAPWEEVGKLERPTHYHRKTMVIAFFNGTGEWLLNLVPRSRSMDTKYFAEEIIGGLEDVCHPGRRNQHERRIALHFDYAPIHNTRTVMGQLEPSEFKRMEHPAHSPDLAPCDFFLFGYVKEQLKGKSLVEEGELLSVPSAFLSEIPPDLILRVFADWNRRRRLCLRMAGE